MTYTLKKYKSYQEYLDAEELSPEGDYRLLSTGEAIEVASEDKINLIIIYALIEALVEIQNASFLRFIRRGDQELQVQPVGDRWVNRKPDLTVLRPEHLEKDDKAIFFGMAAPVFVAEVVSPGGENSVNYKRDYIWKRQQYEWWQIPEYWIIDPHREKVTVLTLVDEVYDEKTYSGEDKIVSSTFPALNLTVEALFSSAL